MKCTALLFAFVLSAALAAGQNLVPNPSFEEYSNCPYAPGSLNAFCEHWFSMAYTPDFFHTCSSDMGGIAGVPENEWGFQHAITGNGYAAFYSFSSKLFPQGINLREYLGAQLSEPMVPGQTYYVMFYASQVEGEANGELLRYGRCATNHIGLRFMKDPEYNAQNPFLPDNIAHIDFLEVLDDDETWTIIHGQFTADEAYNWVVIGNFFDDENTTIQFENEWGNCWGVYFVENVCVAIDPADCDYLLDIKDKNKDVSRITVYPNPILNLLNISLNENETGRFNIYDLSGRTMREGNLKAGLTTLAMDFLAQGLYTLTIRTNKNEFITFKIIKQ